MVLNRKNALFAGHDQGAENWACIASLIAPPDVAAPAHAITIRRAAEMLGEDEELLWDIATDMGPEHGCLWIYDTDDHQTVAFTPDAMEYLREMLPEYKLSRSPPRS